MESEDKQVGSSKPKEKWIQNNREKEKGKKRGKKKTTDKLWLESSLPSTVCQRKALCFI